MSRCKFYLLPQKTVGVALRCHIWSQSTKQEFLVLYNNIGFVQTAVDWHYTDRSLFCKTSSRCRKISLQSRQTETLRDKGERSCFLMGIGCKVCTRLVTKSLKKAPLNHLQGQWAYRAVLHLRYLSCHLLCSRGVIPALIDTHVVSSLSQGGLWFNSFPNCFRLTLHRNSRGTHGN